MRKPDERSRGDAAGHESGVSQLMESADFEGRASVIGLTKHRSARWKIKMRLKKNKNGALEEATAARGEARCSLVVLDSLHGAAKHLPRLARRGAAPPQGTQGRMFPPSPLAPKTGLRGKCWGTESYLYINLLQSSSLSSDEPRLIAKKIRKTTSPGVAFFQPFLGRNFWPSSRGD